MPIPLPRPLPCMLLLLPLLCEAGRPLFTDDAGVLDPGRCELVGAGQQTRQPGQRASEAALEGACGLGWHSQLGLGLSSARAGGSTDSGASLAGKTGLWQGGEGGAALTLSWRLDASKAAADSWRHAGTGLNLLATVPLGPGHLLHANLGHGRDELGHQRSTAWGLAFEHGGLGPDKAWAPMAELFGDDRSAPWWNLGLRLTVLPDKAWLDMAWGRQIHPARPSLWSLGFKLTH